MVLNRLTIGYNLELLSYELKSTVYVKTTNDHIWVIIITIVIIIS